MIWFRARGREGPPGAPCVVWESVLSSSLLARLLSFSSGLAFVVSASGVARASGFDLFGVHPEGMAEASARAAAAEDGSACFYNPGGLSLGKGYRVDLSANGVASWLDVQGERVGIDEPFGGTLTVAADVPFEGPLENRVRVGLAMYGLADRMMRLRVRSPSTPFFPYYDNRSQRLVVIPALSVRVAKGVGLGVGVNALAGVQGPIDVREGQSRTLESRVVQEAGTVARWIVGVRFDPSDGVRIGVAFRQSFGVPLSIATTADVAGVPLSVDVSAAEALFDPATVVLGARFAPFDAAAFELDVAYHRWSAWEGPLLGIDTTVSALSLSSKPSERMFRDSVSVRSAAAWTVDRDVARETTLHVGAGYETSMLDDTIRQGRTNLVDGTKVILGAGVSVRFAEAVGRGLRVGLGVQLHHVGQFRQDKVACTQVPCPAGTVVGPDTAYPSADIDDPGYPTLAGGGQVLAGAVGVGVDL